MTTSKSNPTDVVVVDGSNIATEGRSMPSLAQLQDAVMAFKDEYPDAVITVVVDATFGHRIDKKESREFDAAVAHNELVAPPAGAIGRGDAFVLSIANKVGARILSNDSFQEFHGDYPWLFDEGRLIGGKPVPYVGWVFVERLPVKGPLSRKSQRAARTGRGEAKPVRRSASKEASLPLPVPTAPPPGARRQAETRPEPVVPQAAPPVAPTTGSAVNDLLPFLDFVEHHPVGSSVNGVVDSYSSHGAYVMVGDLRGYVPLRLMSDPPPRSAREVMHVGDAVTLVVVSFAPARRSVDLAVPHMAPGAAVVATPEVEVLAEAAAAPAPKPARRAAKKAAATPDEAPAKRTATKRTAKKVAAAAPEVEIATPAEAAPAPKAPAKRTAKKAAATTTATTTTTTTTKAPVKKAPAKRPAKKSAASDATVEAVAPAPVKKAPAKRAARRAVPAPDVAPSADGDTSAPGPPASRAKRSRAKAASPAGAS